MLNAHIIYERPQLPNTHSLPHPSISELMGIKGGGCRGRGGVGSWGQNTKIYQKSMPAQFCSYFLEFFLVAKRTFYIIFNNIFTIFPTSFKPGVFAAYWSKKTLPLNVLLLPYYACRWLCHRYFA